MVQWHNPTVRATDRLHGLVWKRSDFRESSRLITLLTPEHGRLVVLGKGAHRSNSQCLGRIDLFNSVAVKISGGTLPVLHRVRLLHEPRGLRSVPRFQAASYLAELFDPAFLPGRADAILFELLTGGLKLLERCPIAAIPQIVCGIELRYLDTQGHCPTLTACTQCGAPAASTPLHAGRQGLFCADHRDSRSGPIPPTVLDWLNLIATSPGRVWTQLPTPPRGATSILGRWVVHSAERRPRMRGMALLADSRE